MNMSRRAFLSGVAVAIVLPLCHCFAAGPEEGRPRVPSEVLIETIRQDDALRLQEDRRRSFEDELGCRRQPDACEPPMRIEERPGLKKDLDEEHVPSEPKRPPVEELR